MNFRAFFLRSSEMLAGMPTPAPPVGQLPSPGRNAVPTGNFASLATPPSDPVDIMLHATMPAVKSGAGSFDSFRKPCFARFCRYSPALTVFGSEKVGVHSFEYAPP